MLDSVRPEAVAAFGSTFDHLSVVEACAPRGMPVMVEKPLAVNLDQARQIRDLARTHGIDVLTNYETTWYATTDRLCRMAEASTPGGIRKIVVHDGHFGPSKIGCPPEFLAWLNDPKLNGAGALFDFGCYGVNLATRLLAGAVPTAVTAVTQQLQPDLYPRVDDEATVVLAYPHTQVIIQASWNWPFHRKDLEIYADRATLIADDGRTLRIRRDGSPAYEAETLAPLAAPFDDAFSHLAAVVRKDIGLRPDDLSGLANNVVVVEVLEAARRSAELGRTVALPPDRQP